MNGFKQAPCFYSAQGALVCKRTSPLINEAFTGDACNESPMFKECQNDNDCRDSTMSCRIMPVSKNATTKVCMPDDVQYVKRVVSPF